jgi:formylglycine-generating enzyme required for sulfatase activity
MVEVSGGIFKMGDFKGDGDSTESPLHEVSIRSFAIGICEVTFEEYDQFAKATGRKPPDDQGWGRGRQPVINVSWEDSVEYARWLSGQTGKRYRLPTEAEWEYAARSGGKDEVWAGTSTEAVLSEYAWYEVNSSD